jgi:hypothetical protein
VLVPRYLQNAVDVDVFQQYRQSPGISIAECKEYTLKNVETDMQINHTFFSVPLFTTLMNHYASVENLDGVRATMITLERIFSIYTD